MAVVALVALLGSGQTAPESSPAESLKQRGESPFGTPVFKGMKSAPINTSPMPAPEK